MQIKHITRLGGSRCRAGGTPSPPRARTAWQPRAAIGVSSTCVVLCIDMYAYIYIYIYMNVYTYIYIYMYTDIQLSWFIDSVSFLYVVLV